MNARLIQQWNAGMDISFFSPAERAELRQMFLQHPGYMDAKHPEHKDVLHDTRQLYEADAGPEAAE